MVCVWLQLQTTRRGVFSQKRRKTNKNKDDYCMTTTNKQQWEVCFLRIVDKHTKRPMNTDALCLIATTKRGVFSGYKTNKQKDPQIKMICAWLQLQTTGRCVVLLLFFFQDRWQTKTEKDPQIKICAWLQLQTTRRGVCSSGQRTHEQDQRSCR